MMLLLRIYIGLDIYLFIHLCAESKKFTGRGAGGVYGVGGAGEETGERALSVTLTTGPAHGHARQRDVGAPPERPAPPEEKQVGHQESRLHGPERLLRTQDGQDRHHQRHGLLGAEQKTVFVSKLF